MNKLNLRLIIIVLSSISAHFSTQAQNKVVDRFTIRKSFQTKEDWAKPAVITFTKPQEKSASWLLDMAIGYSAYHHPQGTLSVIPYMELHRNTLIDKPQSVWIGGVATEWRMNSLEHKKWSPILVQSFKFMEDKVKQNASFQSNFYLTPVFAFKDMNPKYFWIPNHPVSLGSRLSFVYTPYIGIENENRTYTETHLSAGNIYRAFGRISTDITFYPSNNSLKGKLDLSLDWQYRYNYYQTVSDVKNSTQQFLNTSLNYTFFTSSDGKKMSQIGFDYTIGENPTEGFEKQSFYTVALKFRLNLGGNKTKVIL
ncbi:hypothetical protein [Flectobacillus longus]|uniref:hypothetical protein n=1 Tax=Flectobacillus longus TaxID=2984207 RepID=UPI0024B72BDB|nr:hypothetical protein [Flectobacillus longus]MDI9877975.1 hypothetical protein [Flectobacillus longus]